MEIETHTVDLIPHKHSTYAGSHGLYIRPGALSYGPVAVRNTSRAQCVIQNNRNHTVHWELIPVTRAHVDPPTEMSSPFVFMRTRGWLLPHASVSIDCIFTPPMEAAYTQFIALKSNSKCFGVMRVSGFGYV